jgi:hypothetical protein
MLFAVAILFTACKKDDDNDQSKKPQVPPASSLTMDFNSFSDPSDTLSGRTFGTYHHWGYAYLTVLGWHTAVSFGMAIPVAAFTEAFNHEAVYNPDANNWLWSYNVTADNSVYLAKLTGEVQADSVYWEMKITRSNVYTDFLWFYGKSSLNNSGGYWILMNNPGNANKMLQIDWHRSSDVVGDIKYTNVIPGDAQKGAYIAYGTSTGNYNRFYKIYNKVANNLTDIEWHHEQKFGHVKDPVHFKDANWHCWDENLRDTQCE